MSLNYLIQTSVHHRAFPHNLQQNTFYSSYKLFLMSPRALHIAPHEHPDRSQDKDSAVQALLLFDSLCIHALFLQIPSKFCQILTKHQKLFAGRGKSQNPDCVLNSRTAFIQCMRGNSMKLRIKGHPSVYRSHTSKPQLICEQHV